MKMPKIAVCLATVIGATLFTAFTLCASTLCGPITNPANGHTYYMLAPSTWTDAEAEAVTMGGHLATIRNDAENTWVADTFGNYGGALHMLWIGLSDAALEGTFVWSSGESSPYRNWDWGTYSHQPDNGNGTGEDFAHIFSPGTHVQPGWSPYTDYKWNDLPAQTNFGSASLNGVVEVTPPVVPPPYITSLAPNGQLTWTNIPGTNCFSIQWAPSVTGPWSPTYRSFLAHVTTNVQTTIPVPMFYRLAQGFNTVAMLGTWMTVNPATLDNMFFIAQSDGVIPESGMFIPRGPSGYFTLDASGHVTNTFLTTDGNVVLSGKFLNADTIAGDPPYSAYTMQRVTDATLCAGNWSGTLTQTTGPGMPFSKSLNFTVDNRGLLKDFSITGYSSYGVGRMFALTNGNCIAFCYAGRSEDIGVYNQIKLSGSLTGNSFSGVYFTDSPNSGPDQVFGTVTLSRQ